jgi:hypothetical protein
MSCLRYGLLGYECGSSIVTVPDINLCDLDCLMDQYRRVNSHIERYQHDPNRLQYFQCAYEGIVLDKIKISLMTREISEESFIHNSPKHKEFLLLEKIDHIVHEAMAYQYWQYMYPISAYQILLDRISNNSSDPISELSNILKP